MMSLVKLMELFGVETTFDRFYPLLKNKSNIPGICRYLQPRSRATMSTAAWDLARQQARETVSPQLQRGSLATKLDEVSTPIRLVVDWWIVLRRSGWQHRRLARRDVRQDRLIDVQVRPHQIERRERQPLPQRHVGELLGLPHLQELQLRRACVLDVVA